MFTFAKVRFLTLLNWISLLDSIEGALSKCPRFFYSWLGLEAFPLPTTSGVRTIL